MEDKFQFFNKTGQRGVPTKSFGTSGQQVEKRYCPSQNGMSSHFTKAVNVRVYIYEVMALGRDPVA